MHENHRAVDGLECLHDRRLVWASSIPGSALWKVVLVSSLLAFFEYCLQVPANRIGYGQFTAAQLKIVQEVITLIVFVAFAWLYLGERPRWNEATAFALVLGAVIVANLPG